MRFFGGPADLKEIAVLDSAAVFRIEVNDEYGDSVEYTLYRRRTITRADGSQVDVMVAGDVDADVIAAVMR